MSKRLLLPLVALTPLALGSPVAGSGAPEGGADERAETPSEARETWVARLVAAGPPRG